MRIAVFVSYLPPHVGGIEVIAESQVRALAADGDDVEVISSSCESRPGRSSQDGYTTLRISAWNYFEKRLGAVFPIYSPSLLWHSYRAVKNADVVHAHDAFYLTSLAAAFWARLLKKPLILTQHVDMVPHPVKLVGLMQSLAYATTGRFILRSSNVIMVLNSRVKSFLVAKGVDEQRIVFLPNPVDTEAFTPATAQMKSALRVKYGLPADRPLALFMGRFVPKKGFQSLLEITSDKVDIVFAGGNAPSGHKNESHHFVGTINRPSAPEIFKACDIFVLPSRGEGFPVTVQEAMATGLPVITTSDPAYRVYQLDPSLVRFVETDTECLHRALEEIAVDPLVRERMGEYCRAYALKHFAPSTHIMRLRAIYKDQIT